MTLASIGWENLRKPQIRAQIERRLGEFHLSADEVLARLAFMAQGDVSPFLDEGGDIDFTSKQAKSSIYLLKKARVKRGTTKSGDHWVEREIELHDPLTALVHVGRHLKLFTDKVEVDDTGLDDTGRARRILEILDAARARQGRQTTGDSGVDTAPRDAKT